MKSNLEYRGYGMEDVKVNKEARTIEARAVVYNSMSNTLRTNNGTEFREIIKPGALTDSMAKNDVLAFKEHNPVYLLGRKSAGTLQMEDRADGLYVRIDIPQTSYGDDTLISAARGDLTGMSFGFNNAVSKNSKKGSEMIREISALNLREVSIVASPAYAEAGITAMRNEDFIEEEVTPIVEEKREEPIVEQKAEQKVEPVLEQKRDMSKEYELKFKFLSLTHK
jgi:HK97 family phage prohead protease